MAYKTDSEKRRRARIASVLQRHWTSAFVLTSSNSATFVVQQAQNQIVASRTGQHDSEYANPDPKPRANGLESFATQASARHRNGGVKLGLVCAGDNALSAAGKNSRSSLQY
ncbi:hypothetical protein BT96DRAFT_1008331 [Gymnopus androsaceus JB14]|uniref:Uncharacterized protein n=1 Tax=Gymnopus androsaceus JB14 TaxID=1447944 RepID=A0A6A4GF53_9AGAR|nr:hypothetical protein BT96DRAFT_1008331 [Gymnopus androsaceus JB14]